MVLKSKFDRSRRKEFHKTFARELRRTPTDAERKLWFYLRAKRFGRFKFRRQQPIGPFIADFYCSTEKLIVELDGGQHTMPANLLYDERRSRWLAGRGYRVIRFSNVDVLKDIEIVLDGIWHHLRAAP